MDGPDTQCCRNIAEIFNCLSRAHERYRQTDDRQTDRQTDGRAIAYSERESRSLKIVGSRGAWFILTKSPKNVFIVQEFLNGKQSRLDPRGKIKVNDCSDDTS